MQANPVPSQTPGRVLSNNLSMIGLGTLLVVLTLYILTFFDSGIVTQAQTISAPGKAAPPELALLTPVEIAPAQQLSAEDQLRALIERANRAFIEARGSADAAPLSSVAIGDWLAQEQRYIAAMRGRGQYERWRMVKLEYIEINPHVNPMFVCTRETWEYSIVGPGGAATPTQTIVVSNGYYVTPTTGGWYVTRLDMGPG
jgi:hypothetical protein